MLTNLSSIPTLIAQLQSRYPAASLIAEFVTIHQDSFVVRALVQVGGITLATGMASATDIEQAEDRAKVRALTMLGIGSFTPSIPSQSDTHALPTPIASSPPADLAASEPLSNPIAEDLFNSLAPNLKPAPFTESLPSFQKISTAPSAVAQSTLDQPANFATSASFVPLPQVESKPTESDRAEYELNYEPESYEFENPAPQSPTFEHYSSADAPEIDLLPPVEPPVKPNTEVSSPSLEAALPFTESYTDTEPVSSFESTKPASSTGKGKSAKRKTESTEVSPPITGENDRSEEIAKIGLEMKRLGWTTEQGRNYLKRTYGKRSRQELDDSELIDFLRYLETQAAASESPF